VRRHAPESRTPRAAVGEALRTPGAALDPATRAGAERRLGHDLAAVRVHADARAAATAVELGADAYTFGPHVVFAPGRDADGPLLAHELVHVAQQDAGPGVAPERVSAPSDAAEQEAERLARAPAPPRRRVRGVVLRQRPARRRAPDPAPLATPEVAAEFLADMVRFVQGARAFAREVLARPLAGTTADAARRRAHASLNQTRLREMLRNARAVLDAQLSVRGTGTAATPVRLGLLRVMEEIRQAAAEALTISAGMDQTTAEAEQRRHAELTAELIGAAPITSAGLAGSVPGAAEQAAGTEQQAFLERYLDDLLARLPTAALAQADRDRVHAQILDGLRRAFVGVSAGPSGAIDVRAITNPAIVDKYRRVTALLVAGQAQRPALSVITDTPPRFTLPADPLPDVSARLGTRQVDLAHVPEAERTYVRYGVAMVSGVVFGAGSTVQLQNASWPVVLPVRRGGGIVHVRYDLLYDAAGNVRPERLGEHGPAEVPPDFASKTVDEKRAALVADFGLAAVDDRPAAAPRTAAVWTSAELDQIKALFDRLPARDRPVLSGVTLVRDHTGPAQPGGLILGGVAHTGHSAAHDEPGPPAHPAPHIHFYDSAFDAAASTATGAPGASGPGSFATFAHEVGHFRIYDAMRRGNAAIVAANRQIVAANAGLPAINVGLPQAQDRLRAAWGTARAAVSTAVSPYGAAVTGNATATPPVPPAPVARQRELLAQVRVAVAARDRARAALAPGGVPAGVVRAIAALDASIDALVAAYESVTAAQDQVPIFVHLAGQLGLVPFTDYARRGGDDEFFSETYSLYVTDPSRLNQMSRGIFLWFEAGMPMDRAWRPQ
jgi:hypothetical protein